MTPTIRRRKENHVAGGEVARRGIFKAKIDAPAQVRIDTRDRRPGFASRRNGDNFNVRMLRQQAQQLDTGISGATNDTDLDHANLLKQAQDDSLQQQKRQKPPNGGFCGTA